MKKKYIDISQVDKERCLLMGVSLTSDESMEINRDLNELEELVYTAGALVVDKIIQTRKKLDAAYYVGKGKAIQVAHRIVPESIDIVIFDDELSPAQIRNWEKLTNVKVMDRSALILDIFASHAQSREARTQVELAQLTYLLPRLTRQWGHLSRQVGGIGTKGPGETQLETDRRQVRARISHLKKDLDKIVRQRQTQRKKAKNLIRVSLIGYTNAGKSTLLNILTGSKVSVADKLFETLETTTRRLKTNQRSVILLSDTVGFIKKLPHHLIASFQSTLAQTSEADILLHVVDISNPDYQEHIGVVRSLMTDMNIANKPTVLVFNKVDKLNEDSSIHYIKSNYPEALLVSAKNHIRVERIIEKLISSQ
jgi:GTP-binding protein HflX